MILAFYAQNKVDKAYNKYSKVMSKNGLTGHEVAEKLLYLNGVTDVKIGRVGGRLSDNYSPEQKVLPSPLGCVGSFLSLNKGNDIKVTLVGNKGTVSIPFTKADAAAFLQVYELAMALNSINELEKQHDDLTRRIDFLVRRMQSDSISQPE